MSSRRCAALLLVLVPTFVVLAPAPAHAQTVDEAWAGICAADESGLWNGMALALNTSAESWAISIGPYALGLFLVLAFLELAWTLYDAAFRRDIGVEGVAVAFFRRLLVLLILFAILTFAIPAPNYAGAFYVSQELQRVGSEVSGLDALRPCALFAQVDQATNAWWNAVQKWGPNNILTFMSASLMGGVGTLIGALALYVAILLFILTYIYVIVEGLLLVSGGVLLLGFAGSRFTLGWAESYPTALLRNALRFFLLFLLTAVFMNVVGHFTLYYQQLAAGAPPWWEPGVSTPWAALIFGPLMLGALALVFSGIIGMLPRALLGGLSNLSLRALYGEA